MSDAQHHLSSLDYIEAQLSASITREELTKSIMAPLEKMLSLMTAAIEQAGEKPDLIYITGGSAKSPVIRNAIQHRLGDIPVLDGDHFGSVAAGLTVWAERIFR